MFQDFSGRMEQISVECVVSRGGAYEAPRSMLRSSARWASSSRCLSTTVVCASKFLTRGEMVLRWGLWMDPRALYVDKMKEQQGQKRGQRKEKKDIGIINSK
jgi:hypothetical protein